MTDICLWYRCRQCGAVFADIAAASGELMHKRVIDAANDSESPWLHSFHNCGPDRLGLSDLIGSAPTPATRPQTDPPPSTAKP